VYLCQWKISNDFLVFYWLIESEKIFKFFQNYGSNSRRWRQTIFHLMPWSH
jgi:hypothetical protein